MQIDRHQPAASTYTQFMYWIYQKKNLPEMSEQTNDENSTRDNEHIVNKRKKETGSPIQNIK